MAGLNDHLDVLSERLITIGGSPVSTLKEFDELSNIELETATWDKTTEERLTEVVKAYKYLSDLFQDGVHATDEEDDEKKKNKSVNYGKISTAIGETQKKGIPVLPPDINRSSLIFTPDLERNSIVYGLKGM